MLVRHMYKRKVYEPKVKKNISSIYKLSPHEAFYLICDYFNRYNELPEETLVEDLEDIISKSPVCSFLYADYVLNGRFLLGETTIFESKKYDIIYKYAIDFFKEECLGITKLIDECDDPDIKLYYYIHYGIRNGFMCKYMAKEKGGFFYNFQIKNYLEHFKYSSRDKISKKEFYGNILAEKNRRSGCCV